MIKPRDYDNVQASTYGDAELNAPVPGGHGVTILKAETGKDDYGDKLVLYFDIKEGSESDGYYKAKYERAKSYGDDAKWQGIFNQYIFTKDGQTNPFFKGLISSIEKSNPGYTWSWQEEMLKGKKLGLIFREEKFYGKKDGLLHSVVRPAWACDWDSYEAIPAPKPKEPKEPKNTAPLFETEMTPNDDDDDLPF